MSTSALRELEKLEKRRLNLLGRAKKEALARAEKCIEDLNSLGERYVLVNESSRNKTNSTTRSNLLKNATSRNIKSRKGTRTPKDRPCPICLFRTKPLHDKRSHRMQRVKKALSKKELSAKGLTRV